MQNMTVSLIEMPISDFALIDYVLLIGSYEVT